MNNLSNHIRIRKKTNLSPLSNKYRMALKGSGKSIPRKNSNKKRSYINIVKLPKKELSKKEPPKKDQPKKEPPKKELSKKEPPKKDQPKKEPPKKDPPKKDQPKKELSKKEQPKKDPPKKSKRIHKRHTRNRKISFKCTPKKNKNIYKILKSMETMTNDKMKNELIKKGINIKGNKNKIVEDIYLFSEMGGITILKE
jgi:hypothetical protein